MSAPDSSPRPSARMPVYFIPHGAGPCFFMDWQPATTWVPLANFLRGIAASLPARPSAILLISAHWLAGDFRLGAAARPALIYDYYGFPPHTYQLEYPAAGAPLLAEQISQRLQQQGLPSSNDRDRGLDHGAFIPLKLMFPAADIPVLQLSLREDLDAAAHLAAGEALQELRDQGVLIVGSGMSFHNMRGYGDHHFTQRSELFDQWLGEALASPPAQRRQLLQDWTAAPHARDCHPPGAEEHLLPLMVAAGAAGTVTAERVYSEILMETRISAWRFA